MEPALRERLIGAIDDLTTLLHSGWEARLFDTLTRWDLSFTQARVMYLISRAETALPIHEVANGLGTSVATAGRNVDRLMALGLVDRREDPGDRRVKRVSLTAAGRELTGAYTTAMRGQIADLVDRIPSADACLLVRVLTDAVDAAVDRAGSEPTRV